MPDDQQPTTLPAIPMMGGLEIWEDQGLFQHYQRCARMLGSTAFIPKALVSKDDPEQTLANMMVCFSIARAQREDPILVAQNIFFVDGRPGWAANYMISRANRSGRLAEEITWIHHEPGEEVLVGGFRRKAGAKITVHRTVKTGKKLQGRFGQYDEKIRQPVEVENIIVTATARLRNGREVRETLDLVIADADDWTRNEKYFTIPQHMLELRTATWLIRKHIPEVMSGLPTQEEILDQAIDVTPDRREELPPPRPSRPAVRRMVAEPEAEPEPGPASPDPEPAQAADESEPEPEPDDGTLEPHPPLYDFIDPHGNIREGGLSLDGLVSHVLHEIDQLRTIQGGAQFALALIEYNEAALSNPEIKAVYDKIKGAETTPAETESAPEKPAEDSWTGWYRQISKMIDSMEHSGVPKKEYVAFHKRIAKDLEEYRKVSPKWANAIDNRLRDLMGGKS